MIESEPFVMKTKTKGLSPTVDIQSSQTLLSHTGTQQNT